MHDTTRPAVGYQDDAVRLYRRGGVGRLVY